MGSYAFHVDSNSTAKGARTSHGIAVHVIGLSEYEQSRIRKVVSDVGVGMICHSDPDLFFRSRRIAVGCAVCAFKFPLFSGFEFHQRMLVAHPELPIIFVDRSPAISDVVRAIRAGASNFLDESWSQPLMRLAITEALAEGRERRARVARRADANTRFSQLDAIDAAVLDLLIQGCPNKAVAARLGIGLRTVERRRASALRTLGINSLIEAVALLGQLEEDSAPADASRLVQRHMSREPAFHQGTRASR